MALERLHGSHIRTKMVSYVLGQTQVAYELCIIWHRRIARVLLLHVILILQVFLFVVRTEPEV